MDVSRVTSGDIRMVQFSVGLGRAMGIAFLAAAIFTGRSRDRAPDRRYR
jgi:hypothetical protein